jgi:hypothetical protein
MLLYEGVGFKSWLGISTMRRIRPIAALAAAAAICISAACVWAADDKERPFGGPSPQRNTEERPFGGPPPGNRDILFKKAGKKCATAAGVCDLSKARAVGTLCTCPEGDDKGAEGKVE